MKWLSKISHRKMSSFWPLMDQIIVSGSNFLLSVFLSRVLGLELFGVYALLFVCVLFASSLQQSFIHAPLQTFMGKLASKDREDYIQSVYGLQLIFMVLTSILITVGIYLYDYANLNSLYKATLSMGLLVFSYLSNDFVRKLQYVRSAARKAVIIDVITYVGVFGSLIVLQLFSILHLKAVILAIALAYFVPVVLFGKTYTRFRFLKPTFTKHWSYSKWLMGTSLLQWFSGNIFLLVGAQLLGVAVVGIFRIVQNVFGILNVILLATENVVPVQASIIFNNKGFKTFTSYLLKMLFVVAGFITILSVGLTVFGKTILFYVYGMEYVSYSYLFTGFSILYVLVSVGTITRFFIRTIERTSIIFIAYIVSTLFSLLVVHFTLNNFGLQGIIYGFVFTQLIMQMVFMFCLRIEIKKIWKLYTSY